MFGGIRYSIACNSPINKSIKLLKDTLCVWTAEKITAEIHESLTPSCGQRQRPMSWCAFLSILLSKTKKQPHPSKHANGKGVG